MRTSSTNQQHALVEQWIASDGCLVTIRPIRPADLELEKEFVHCLSANTGYQRLMSSRTPSIEELKRFTDVDPAREVALIAVTTVQGAERQIGVVRFVNDPISGDAEFAIVLSDAWQQRGLGTKLLDKLIVAAKDFGVHRLVGITLTTNVAMIALARKSGFKIAGDPRDGSVTNMTLELSGV